MRAALMALAMFAAAAGAETRYVVQVAEDGSATIPPNTIATPAQLSVVSNQAAAAQAAAVAIEGQAAECEQRVSLYSSNYVVTSTVYVQSVGAIPYDPSNQTVRIYGLTLGETNVQIVATVSQEPLVTPSLDWRVALGSGAWSNISATVTVTDIPEGVTNAAAAYLFDLPRTASNAFFRVVDNSTGASGSGLYWLVYGGIYVDGNEGWSGVATNVVGEVTNVLRFVGGIAVEEEPLGGF